MQNQDTEKINMPLRLETYEEAFFDFDYRPIPLRTLNEDLDTIIKEMLFKSDNMAELKIELLIHLPKAIENSTLEEETRQGIINHYKAFQKQANKIRKIGFIRLLYYVGMSLLLFVIYYFVESSSGVSFLSTMLSTAATVILWQASTLIFIDRKNLDIDIEMNQRLANCEIRFIYD